jgi:hypothetical protein
MFHRLLKACCTFALCVGGFLSASGQITVNGVSDKVTYPNTATFTIVSQPGYTYTAFLNTNSVPIDVPVTVSEPDYYELSVRRMDGVGGVTTLLVRFIVEAAEREDTEWGLPRQFAWPMVPSSSAEFEGAHLRLVAPQQFPAGYEIPVVAWIEDDNGHAIRGNGLVAAPGHPSIQIRRGVGSGFLGSTNAAGLLDYSPTIQGLTASKSIALESNTSWTTVNGMLGGTVTWPDNSRIFIDANVIVSAGATLTIGAGTIVRLNPRTDITNNGAIVINGTREQPVVFMPNARSQPWGGFMMRNGTGSITGTGVIFTGSGAVPNWFGSSGNPGSHRPEQALFFVANSQSVSLTDSAAIYLAGQLSHAVSGGTFIFDHFLMQRVTSGGEFTGSNWRVNDSAFIECPDDSVTFVNGDNDALYFVSGIQSFTNSLIGWTKDDGIDSGGSGFGTITYQSCWFEATVHEGNSLSGFKNVLARDTVFLGCGQGFEDGYDSPTGRVDNCLISCNQVGVRHGDNYQNSYNYNGRVSATNSILLYNHHDVFGYNWNTSGGWTQALGQTTVIGNRLTAPDTNYPNNSVWNPAADAGRLATFGARGRVGIGFATRGENSATDFPGGIPVGLSTFCTNEVTVGYSILGTDGTSRSGVLTFPAGKTRDYVPLPSAFNGVLRVTLENPVNADLTGSSKVLLQNRATSATVLSPLGANWKYLDDGSDQGTAWRGTNFVDSSWSSGTARLGFGPDAAANTTIRRYLSGTSGPQFTNYYFRRTIVVTNNLADFATVQFRYQRDDGCILYLNGTQLFTNNMPPPPITFMTFASSTISGAAETQRFWTNTFSPTALRSGTNVIAVEVHQSTSTSSDIAWEMELLGIPPVASARVNISQLGSDAVLYWSDASYSLQEADAIAGPWRAAATTNSPAAVSLSGNRFFRLRR